MLSQCSRPFSQECEMSQLSGSISGELCINNAAGSIEKEVEELAQYSDDCNAELNSQTEEPLSARADAICEQNRQIRGFVEKNLKQIEKKRINLFNKKSVIEDQVKFYLDKQKQQSQKSVELQMNIEEMGEKYSNELDHRKALTEMSKNTQIFVDYLIENLSQVSKFMEDLENVKNELSHQFEKLSTTLKEKADEKNKLKLAVQSQMEEKKNKAQKTKELLMTERETSSKEIQDLVIQNVENGNNQNYLQEEILLLGNKRTELKDSYDESVLQIKSLKEAAVKLHQQVNELNAAHASRVQNLKLQINNENNNNSNLEVKCEGLKHSINVISTKKNELINLINQMNLASEETTKSLEEKKKELKLCKDKEEGILNEILTLEERITNYESAPNKNTFFKSEISRLEESNKAKEEVLVERQQSADKISREKAELKKTYGDIQANIQELKNDLEKSISYQIELETKLEEDKIAHQIERDAKMLKNKTLQESNMDLVVKMKTLNLNLEEAEILKNKVKSETEKTNELIVMYNTQINEAEEKLKVNESEWEEKCKAFNERIDLKNNKLDNIEELIIEARPYQDELVEISARKETLNKDIQQQKEKHFKTVENLKSSFSSKILEISAEAENYTSIMKGIIKAEEDARERSMEEIKSTEVLRNNHEADLANLFRQIKKLKKEEQIKRKRVVKLENKIRTINKEIKITRQDISDAITGNALTPAKGDRYTNVINPTSFRDSVHKFQEPPQKKMATSLNIPDYANFSQIKTKEWVESSSHMHEDEYEFSDI